jgi:solute carrier family 25 S-adenosylmethionine transporter 26
MTHFFETTRKKNSGRGRGEIRVKMRSLCFILFVLLLQCSTIWGSAVAVIPAKRQVSVSASASASSLSVPQRILAGGAGRCLGQLLLYPVDALRTLAQTRDTKTLADLGTRALVSGCATTSSFALVAGAIQFSIFGACKATCIGTLGASTLSGIGSCVVSIPQDVLKQRLITGIYPNFRTAVRTIFQTEGLLGFYNSWKPTMARNVPFVIVCFSTADALTKWRLSVNQQTSKDASSPADHTIGTTTKMPRTQQLSVGENLAVGVMGALVGGFVTQPMDVVKTRMMTQAASTAIPYDSALDCITKMIRTEPAKLWSGLAQRSCYMGPLWAIQFAVNGRISKTLETRNAARHLQ